MKDDLPYELESFSHENLCSAISRCTDAGANNDLRKPGSQSHTPGSIPRVPHLRLLKRLAEDDGSWQRAVSAFTARAGELREKMKTDPEAGMRELLEEIVAELQRWRC